MKQSFIKLLNSLVLTLFLFKIQKFIMLVIRLLISYIRNNIIDAILYLICGFEFLTLLLSDNKSFKCLIFAFMLLQPFLSLIIILTCYVTFPENFIKKIPMTKALKITVYLFIFFIITFLGIVIHNSY